MPIVIPIQAFGREHHRTLTNLPQEPNVRSASKKRLLMTWWEREVRIWTITRRARRHIVENLPSEVDGPQGRKLVARLALQVSIPPNSHYT